MLDKITKACYNFLALFVFAIFNKECSCIVLVKILKGFYQATLKKGRFNQLFEINSFNTASH